MNLSEKLVLSLVENAGDECIEWTGAKSSNGYGIITVQGKQILASRYVKARTDNIDIPHRYVVCRHTCDNPPCINPNHLIWGTMKSNSEDALERGRTARGSKLPQAKMDDDLVREARLFFLACRSLKKTRERYGLTINACRQMLLGDTWGHVPRPIPRDTFDSIVRRGEGKWSAEEINRLVTLRESGLSWANIASEMSYGSPMTPWRMYKEITDGDVSQD